MRNRIRILIPQELHDAVERAVALDVVQRGARAKTVAQWIRDAALEKLDESGEVVPTPAAKEPSLCSGVAT